MKRLFVTTAMMVMALVSSTGARAAPWQPSGTVEIIVAAGAGGGNDRTARLLAKVLSQGNYVKAPIVVVNKPGAGGVVAQNYLNQHQGNGNYLMITNPAIITNPIEGIGTAKYTEITPVAQLFGEYVVLVTRADSPLKSGKDVIERLKRDPGSLTIAASPGLGAGPHVSIAMVAQAAGIDPAKLRVIPFAAAGEAMTSLLGGHVDLNVSTPLNVLAQVQAKTARALGVTAPHRLDGPLAPIPTWREQGVDVEFSNWRGIVGPAGMTPEQLAFWESVLSKLIATPEWKAELATELAQSDYLGSHDSKVFLDAENARLTKVLTQLGLAK
jgi:putative tricarboxylic transport membrane protein